eukprot:2509543-Lingulodinium_polyedra.AAC.1
MSVRELPPMRGFIGATTLLWRPGSTYARIIEQAPEHGQALGRVRLQQEYDDWSRLRVFQLLMVDDTAGIIDSGGIRQAEADAAPSDMERLSTIEEVSNETDISIESGNLCASQ